MISAPDRANDRALLEDLPDDPTSRVGYRIAYGETARLIEMAPFDHGWGRDFAGRVGDEADAIEKQVVRRLAPGIHPELISLTVRDAVVERRKPKW